MKIYSGSPQGNAFVVMGYVRQLLRDSDRFDEWPAIEAKMTAGNYKHLCEVAKEATFGSIEVVDDEMAADV